MRREDGDELIALISEFKIGELSNPHNSLMGGKEKPLFP